MVCLDSDVLINFLRNDLKTIHLIEGLRTKEKNLSTTSINCFELLKGIPKLSKMDKLNVLEFLNNFKILDFNLDSSKKAADIFEELKSNGELIELPDIMIASIAIVNNESIITNNSKHFERIRGLKIEDVSK